MLSLKVALSAAVVAVALGACATQQDVHYVAVPTPQPAPVTPALQACAQHAARGQREAFGNTFTGLQFDTAGLVLTAPEGKVGKQAVGAVYDGDGQWFGRPYGRVSEWRRIRFHCMLSPAGKVVYSFVRSY